MDRSFDIARTFAAGVISLSTVLFGCAGDDRAPQAAGSTNDGIPTVAPTGQSAACVGVEERTCRQVVDQHDGIVDCFEGVQVCDEGTWSECLDRETVARNMSCGVSTLDVPSTDWAPSAKTPASFARAWREATSNLPGGALLVQLTELDSEAKVAVGPSNGRIPAAFSPVTAPPPRFPLWVTKTRAFHLDERETALHLRLVSFGDVISFPIASVKVDGRFATGCRGVESLTITLFIPESAGTLRFGESSVAEQLGAPETRGDVRGWSLVLESRQGS